MAQTHRAALPEGTRVEEFEFHRVLGHGGFGITYLGWDMHLDMAVAIKEFLPSDLVVRENGISVLPRSESDREDYEWGLDRFLDEARILARFKHHNIIQVHRFFRAHGTAYIVMEYAEGDTLGEYLDRKGSLSQSEIEGILFPMLEGLGMVHGASFLHRDIKPGNIIIRDDSSPVLIDFGAARQAIGIKSRSVTSIVTPGYAPIEQYSTKGNQGPWTDIYALGGVAYKCITGEAPVDAAERVHEDRMIGWTDDLKGIDPQFLQALEWALAFKQIDRPQSIMEWRAALEGRSTAGGQKTRDEKAVRTQYEPADPEPRRPKKSRGSATGWIIGGLLATFAAVMVGVYFWMQFSPGERLTEASFYLEAMGYSPGIETERLTPQLQRAVKEFERDNGMFESGKVDAPLIARLKAKFAQLDEAAWGVATAAGTESAFNGYRREFPNGAHIGEIETALDHAAWRAVEAAGTTQAIENYQRDYPNGQHISEVPGALDDAAWAAAQAAGSEAALDEYARRFPNGKQISKVAAAKDEMAWKRAESSGTRQAYETYKAAYPSGRYVAEADRRMIEMAQAALVRAIQTELRRIGHLRSRPDGVLGPTTVVAIRAFQGEQGLTADGRVTQGLLERLRGTTVKNVWIVAKDGSGDVTSIGEALRIIPTGGRIRIKAGVYQETLRIDRTVHFEGVGDRRDVVIESRGEDTIIISGGSGSLTNLTIRYVGSASGRNAIEVKGGNWLVESNDLSNTISTIVFVSGGSPRFRRNRVHDSPWNGFNVKNGSPVIESNEVFGLDNPAIWIGGTSNATVRNNTLYAIKANGILVGDEAQATITDNDISGTEKPGIWVGGTAAPTVTGNRVHHLPSNGIYVGESAKGTFENNDVYFTEKPGVWVGADAAPIFIGNRVHDIPGNAINIQGNARGEFRNNDIRNAGNKADNFPAVYIGKDADVLFSGNKVYGNGNNQIYLEEGSRSRLQNNDVRP
jgi:parallel beta-helix repeat protein